MPSRLFCTSSLIAIAITLGGCGGDTARGTAQEANLGGSPSGDGAGGTGEVGGGGSNAGGSTRMTDAGGTAGVTGASGGTAGAPGGQPCPPTAECDYGASCTDGQLTCICSGLPMPEQPGPNWMCTLLPEGCPLEPATDQTPCGDESLDCQYMHLMVSCSCSSGIWYCGEFDF